MMTFEQFMNSDLAYGKDIDYLYDLYCEYVDNYDSEHNYTPVK